ncbi:MAG: redox-sensing transcriptional repressor Rex [Deltaproteobacteria bacterium]|nr:redox-sensing transcriptional repressor Rex [Deltaproteobacteria bacterium]
MNTQPHVTKVSNSVIRRLSRYHRTLNTLEEQKTIIISSKRISEMVGVHAAQVRKDFSVFGSFGARGIGYDVRSLKEELSNILGLNRKWNIIIIGAGQLGNVLANSKELKKNNFIVKKIFDESPDMIKDTGDEIMVYHLDQIEKKIDPREDHLAIIAVPPREVQSIINRLGKIGIKGVLYFGSRAVHIPENMVVFNQDMSISLKVLAYALKEKCDTSQGSSKRGDS